MIKKYTIAPPFNALPGDTFLVVANVLEQRRGGALVAFRNLTVMRSSRLNGVEVVGSSIRSFFVEITMVSLTVTSVVFNDPVGGQPGTITINYNNGESDELTRDQVETNADAITTISGAKKLLQAKWRGRNPDLNDPSFINGTTVEINMESGLNSVTYGDS